MPAPRKTLMPPPPLVALAGWIVPGAGYWLIGQRGRALAVGITIILMFIAGLFIGGLKAVDAPNAFTMQAILNKPWFIGQILAGPMTLATHYLAGAWKVDYSHARIYEIAVLYTAIAGMLNLMAIIDSSYRAANEGAR